jgi:hypothetical protein
MRKRFLIIVSLAGSLFAETTAPERKIDDNAIISERDPKLRIELPASVQYVGADRWILYEIADCELHAFVEADEQKNVQRLYWIQFEGYIPSRPELHHKYDSPRGATIGGLDFYVDTWTSSQDDKSKRVRTASTFANCLRRENTRCPQMRCVCAWSICWTKPSARS